MNDRHHRILGILTRGNKTSVNELAQELEVSSVTIRQDLAALEDEGLLKRVHGGAVLPSPDDIASRLGVNYDKKARVARAAASLVEDGETILIESGSVNALLARELAPRNKITVVTTNMFIARQLRGAKHVQVILAGGLYQSESESLVGQLARSCVERLNFGKAFIGIDGFSVETGFTSRDMMRAEIASEIVRRAKTSFVLTDSSKFGRTELTAICPVEAVDCLITDSEIPGEYPDFLRSKGVDVILV